VRGGGETDGAGGASEGGRGKKEGRAGEDSQGRRDRTSVRVHVCAYVGVEA
jgi:hypothetical protein